MVALVPYMEMVIHLLIRGMLVGWAAEHRRLRIL